MSDASDLILAGCQTTDAVEKDFAGLVKLIAEKKVRTEGVILVQRARTARSV